MSRLILDIESDGLLREATKIWCVVTQDYVTEEFRIFTSRSGLQDHLDSYDEIWMHNGIAYDMPVLERIWDIHIPSSKAQDTLIVSRMLSSDREGGHSLKSWGETFNFPKGDHTDFTQYSSKMLSYCKQDVQITRKIVQHIEPYIDQFKTVINIDRQFAYNMSLQEKNGFTLDLKFIEEYTAILDKERKSFVTRIQRTVPPVRINTSIYKSSVVSGRLINETELDFTYITEKTKIIKTKLFKFQPFNPNSRKQIAEYFIKKYLWEPTIFTEKGAPDLSEEVLKTLPYNEANMLCKIIRLTKQLGMIRDGANSWLKMRYKEKVYGSVMVNGAVGGRCTHNRPNISQCDKKDLRMRRCWIPREGWDLVGCDAAGLELRMMAHYLYKWDKGAYTRIILNDDIHIYNQTAMGLNDRTTAKTAIYAMIYGAGNEKLGKTVMDDLEQPTTDSHQLMKLGRKIRNRVKDEIIGYAELLDLITETIQTRKYLIGIDGRPLLPRHNYSALNLLFQSAGASVMKKALNNFMVSMVKKGYPHGENWALCANIHDEAQIECAPNLSKIVGDTFVQSIEKVTKDFNLKCPMTGEYKIGKSWKETH